MKRGRFRRTARMKVTHTHDDVDVDAVVVSIPNSLFVAAPLLRAAHQSAAKPLAEAANVAPECAPFVRAVVSAITSHRRRRRRRRAKERAAALRVLTRRAREACVVSPGFGISMGVCSSTTTTTAEATRA